MKIRCRYCKNDNTINKIGNKSDLISKAYFLCSHCNRVNKLFDYKFIKIIEIIFRVIQVTMICIYNGLYIFSNERSDWITGLLLFILFSIILWSVYLKVAIFIYNKLSR